ncbi:MAG: recombinase family protein [Enterocloster clostridioformis]
MYLPVQEDWSSSNVKKILDNPVYYGKIRYGNTKIVWKEGKTCRERNNNPILVDGKHEAIITRRNLESGTKKA